MASRNPACTLCPLHETAQTVCIDGSGPQHADVMFVGEAPGATEDRNGSPFIGRAGQLLDKLIGEYGFKRHQVRVSNAVRCRPPENRDPSAKELKACRTYLIGELRAVSPRVVVALGNFALRSLTGLSGISKARGTLQRLHPDYGVAASVLACNHPSAALKFPHFEDSIREDLALLRRVVDGTFSTIEVPWEWSDRLSAGTSLVAFDIETNARETRDPFQGAYIIAMDDQRWADWPVAVTKDTTRATELLKHVSKFCTVVGHNASRFDRLQLKQLTGIDIPCDDTMIMAWMLHEEWGVAKKLNLESLCVTLLGVEPWKKDVTWDWRDPQSIPWDKAAEYCARDTRYTRELYLRLKPQLDEQGLTPLYEKLLLPASRKLADMEDKGNYVNRRNVAEAKAYYEAEITRNEFDIATIAAFAGIGDINPRSPQQIGELLYNHLGLTVQKWTPKKQDPSTDVEAIKRLRETNPNVPALNCLLAHRKATKMLGYVDRYADQADWQDMIYFWTSLVNTVTGRTAGDGQQTPREPRVRRCIGAPPGYVLLQGDYSQLEMRVAASRYVFDEPNLRAAFDRGDDVHRLLAAEIMRKRPEDVTYEERARAKPPNFLFLYGGEEDMYIRTLLEDYDIVKTRSEATYERDSFFRRWNCLPAGHAKVVNELKVAGEVRTMLGSKRRLPNVFSSDRKVQVEAFRQAVNATVQTPACHIALIGLVLLMSAGIDVRSFQHDAYLAWTKDDPESIHRDAATMKYYMEQGVPQVLRSEFGIDFDVPLVADITVGTAWTENDRSLTDWTC